MSENDEVRKDGYYICLGYDENGQMWMEQLVSVKGVISRLVKSSQYGRFKLEKIKGISEVLIDSYKPL